MLDATMCEHAKSSIIARRSRIMLRDSLKGRFENDKEITSLDVQIVPCTHTLDLRDGRR